MQNATTKFCDKHASSSGDAQLREWRLDIIPQVSINFRQATGHLGKVNRLTIVFYLAVAVVGVKISFIKRLSIFMKRETLKKRHKQSNKHVFRVCMHSYMYITKVT